MLFMRWVLNLNLLHCHKNEQLVDFCVKSSTNLWDETRRRKNREIFSCVRILFNFDWHFLSSSSSALSCRLLSHTVSSSKGSSNNTPRREDVMCTEKKFFSQCSIVFLLSFFLFSSLFFHQRGKVARIFLSPLSFLFWLIHKESKSPHVKLFVFTHFLQSLQLWSQNRELQACDKCAPAVQPPFDNTNVHSVEMRLIFIFIYRRSPEEILTSSPGPLGKTNRERELSVSHDSD